jgi:hypothetical protein
MTKKIIFKERQKFNQWWIWPFFVLTTGLFLYGCVQQIIYKIPFGDNSTSDSGLIFGTIAISLLSALFFVFRLETNITEEAIFVRFFPLHLNFRKYLWTEIETAEVRKYKPAVPFAIVAPVVAVEVNVPLTIAPVMVLPVMVAPLMVVPEVSSGSLNATPTGFVLGMIFL